jgi:putative spermidine/putrescine transport system substrate-binding protein
MTDLSRRQMLYGAASLGVISSLPTWPARAQSGTLIAHTFPPPFQDMTQQVLIPEFERKTGSHVTLTPMLAIDAVTRLSAAQGGRPPFDVVLLDQGPLLDAVKAGVIAEYPVAKSKHYKDLLPVAQDKWGPKFTMQMVGIGYNPKKVKTPPTSWDALSDPAYKGRVGLTALNSSLGIAFLVELARINGGSEGNIAPAFEALAKILPNVGAVSANLGAHAALFQQEQVDIAPHNFNFVETLKGRGVDIEFAVPETGLVGWTTSIHVAANTDKPDLAFDYIETAISPETQSSAQAEPWWCIPTNTKVLTRGPVQTKLGASLDEIGTKFRVQDWVTINVQRSEWIERFNREIRI